MPDQLLEVVVEALRPDEGWLRALPLHHRLADGALCCLLLQMLQRIQLLPHHYWVCLLVVLAFDVCDEERDSLPEDSDR